MQYIRLGRTGLDAPRLCLGCMTSGAVEAGINFFDTANSYSDGTSEEILGRRKATFNAIDASLERLAMDHVDLPQIRRWDKATPIHRVTT